MSRKHALVFSGGGSYGAYAVGVTKALAAQGEVFPEILIGTSSGGFNATFLASRWREGLPTAAAALEAVWTKIFAGSMSLGTNGVFRFRGNPFEVFSQRGLRHPWKIFNRWLTDGTHITGQTFNRAQWLLRGRRNEAFSVRLAAMADISAFISMQPMQHSIRRVINFHRLRDFPYDLGVVVTDFHSGKLVLFDQRSMKPEVGHKYIMASAAIPGIFPPVQCEGRWFVDGGVLYQTPILPAVQQGAEVIHAVELFPRIDQIPPAPLGNTPDAMLRTQMISDQQILSSLLRDLSFYNGLMRNSSTLGEQMGEDDWAKAFTQRFQFISRGRQLTVHRYFPSDFVGSHPMEMLNFSPSHVGRLIEMGIADTRAHSCKKNGCVLPFE